MTREEFLARLRRLSPLAEANPAGYRRRVWLWALLGYAGILLLLLGTVGLLLLTLAVGVFSKAFAIVFKVGAVLAVFAWKVLRSLWVKFDPPEGLPLTPAEAAPLLALLQQQTQALRAPQVHQVLLTADFNAAAVQVPRLGVLGWPRNYVVVGLPLLQSLSPVQAAAVVGHELGHLRGGHGRFGAWIYRVSQTWTQLIEQLERQSNRSLFSRFTAWYVPRFNAWSHPVRRTDEFAADAAAAQLTSPQAMAEALCATVVRDATLDRLHWNVLSASLAERPTPPSDAISRLLPLAKNSRLPAADEQILLANANEAEPDLFSTHPTLGERLAALGQAAAVPPLPATTAAEAWLGASLPALAAALDEAWVSSRAAIWQERHSLLRQQQERLRELTTQQQAGASLTADESWELADLTEDHISSTEALPLFQQLTDDARWKLPARFSVGRILLNSDNAEGLTWLAAVMEQEPNYMAPGLALQEAYYQRQGNREQVRKLGAVQLRHADTLDEAVAEREAIRPADTLLPHGLTEEELQKLRAELAVPEYAIGRAWLMRKQVQYFIQKPLYVLLVARLSTAAGSSKEAPETWVQELAAKIELPGEGFVIAIGKDFAWLERAARQQAAAEVFVA
ncbi:Zn-dependent protease with chaperone function [Hymenobacter daecheongensis DSM 21074]|uniref:Zn-dependent protease with chaperone function n=1 Tax=Hymenobacter daecheongensis DSM 21074 TaxID=1121955 RepID=A0A1M6A9P5_9BACT|nr:M48 family metallopeptidase [Hymenobacter daecheongensis]SHI33181.1 Zn-dependent protease with chaperone function [Hymenobacter daecheongensis DSM 21074]